MKKAVWMLVLPLLLYAQGTGVPTISIVTQDTVTLTDGRYYKIAPGDQKISGGWIANPAEVTIVDTKQGEYPVEITNKATGEVVHGQIPKTVDTSEEG